jgi:Family of unknown function (DUF5677)
MPTDEYAALLNRLDAIERAAPLIDAACPLLRELVNHASHAFRRCTSLQDKDKIGGENEDIAAHVLYRHVIELVDGAEVLFRASCVDAAVPVLRAAFEASLSLDYILQQDYARRSLCWTCVYLHGRIAGHRRLDPNTPTGREMVAVWQREMEHELPARDSTDSVAGLQRVLDRPGLAADRVRVPAVQT